MSPFSDRGLPMKYAYFSHPALSYHTHTEEASIRLIKEELKLKKVINPFDYKGRQKKELRGLLEKADVVVGLSVFEKYPFIVWNDMDYALSLKKKIFTINLPTIKTETLKLEKGFVEDYPKLSPKETEKVYKYILKEETKGAISSLFFGKLGRCKRIF
ncbi:MAG: hypothetical protein ACXQTP_01560 [Candidatus Methanofastidiosia archaeon]